VFANRPSGAKARTDIDELSGTTKVVPFQNSILERLLAASCKARTDIDELSGSA
jgi:hypothetical protein